jgi:hypothetical protein
VELQDLIAEFRSQIDDEAPPYLVSDDSALLYAIDAQDMFVRLTGGIKDVTVAAADVGTPATRLQDLALAEDNPYSAVSPYVLRIRSGRLLTALRDVEFIGEGDLSQVSFSDYGVTSGASLDDTDTGEVRYGLQDIRDGYVRWVRVPDAADTCRLSVYRLPFPRIADQEDDLEIQAQHHLHLVKWMKHLAYSKEDAEIYDKNLADRNEAAFKAYCDAASGEADRRRHKTRVVHYGGL